MSWLKTSRALSGNRECFRIEEKKVYDEICYDLIWQANGEDEEIAMLLDKEDLNYLKKLISLIKIK